MNAARANGGPGRVTRLLAPLTRLFHGLAPRLMAAAGVLFALSAGVFVAWKHYGPIVVNHPRLQLKADNIEITAQPAWIRSDVKAEVIRDGQFATLSIADPQATVKIARAFEGHTWVAHVERVTKKAPARVTVDLRYRRPIAMVVVPDGFWPVDTTGVLLPPTDFSPSQAEDYLQIVGANPQPAGPAGTAYGDRRVAGGAAIAALLEPVARELKLYKIVAQQPSAGGRHLEPEFDLFTRRGVRLIWGHAPGNERPGEPNSVEKQTRLIEYVQMNGSLDAPNGASELDLRNLTGALIPRTANLREPAPR